MVGDSCIFPLCIGGYPNSDKMKTIKLTQGKHSIVDDDDYKRLSRYRWYAANTSGKFYYAVRRSPRLGSKQRTILMHRVILNAPDGTEVDHINGDGLDNRRSNIRLCTCRENSRNQRLDRGSTTGFKGVYFDKRGCKNPYRATIMVNSEGIYLGSYRNVENAARAYDLAAIKHFGKFALTNKMMGLL